MDYSSKTLTEQASLRSPMRSAGRMVPTQHLRQRHRARAAPWPPITTIVHMETVAASTPPLSEIEPRGETPFRGSLPVRLRVRPERLLLDRAGFTDCSHPVGESQVQMIIIIINNSTTNGAGLTTQ